MDSRFRRQQQLAVRILRLREAVQSVEEGRLRFQQQYVQQLESLRLQAKGERDELQQALVGSGAQERRSLYHHQLLALRERYDQSGRLLTEGDQALTRQKVRVQGAYVEAERWRSFSRSLSQSVSLAREDDERKQIEETALSRFWRKKGDGGP